MDRRLQTSFIPKRKGEAKSVIAKIKRPMTLYSWLSTLIFLLSFVLTVGLFGYNTFLVRQIEAKKVAIQKEIEAFEPELTEALKTIKSRIDSGEELLNSHLAVSSFFSVLEAVTLSNVYFYDFSFEASPGEAVSVEAKGISPSYAVLSFQSDLLENADFIRDLHFSDLGLNEEGKVEFTVTVALDSEVVLYKNTISGSPEVIIETGETSTAAPDDSNDNSFQQF